MKTGRKALGWFAMALLCINAFSQTHLPPIAQNDSATVIQPFADTINVTANDTSPSGDNFCIKKVYGSPFFHTFNCNSVIFNSDSSAFGNDTAWYVICNVSQPNLCDTAMMIATVTRHYTPFMLNNSRWTVYGQQGDFCPDGISEEWIYYWTTSDTMINGSSYKKLYSEEDDALDACVLGFTIGSPFLMGYLRQDTLGRKVYYLGADSINEAVLYDFNVAMPDTIVANARDTSLVTSFGYFESGGTYYRSVNVDNNFGYLGWDSLSSEWIEGFGSTLGLFGPYGVGASELWCFSANGKTIYPTYSIDTCAYQTPLGISTIPIIKFNIYPNPASDFCVLQLNGADENYSAEVFDMTGREVLPLFTNQTGSTFNFNVSSLADGLYFVKVHSNDGHVGVSKLVKE